LALAAAVLAARIPETRRPTTVATGPTPLVHRSALAPSLALCSGLVAMAGFLAFVAIHATEDLGLDGASGVLFLFGITVVVSRVALARLPDRVPPFRLGALALTLNAAGLLVVVGLGTATGLAIGAVILAIGVALTTPAFFAAVFARVGPAERGSASGTASLFIDLAFGLGPMLLGVVAGIGGIPAAFVVAAAVTALGAVGSAVLAIRDRRVVRGESVPALD
jgi:predicted MFS family arabinose efflux permease